MWVGDYRDSAGDPRDMLASALDWWRLAGVDMLVDEAPRDWLRPQPRVEAAAVAATPAAPATPVEADLNSVEAVVATLGHAFAGAGTPLAPQGDVAAGLMLLADCPEAEDAAAGMLLSGEVGALLDRMLAAIGRDRASIYLAAIAPVRPVGGRMPPVLAARAAELAAHHAALAAPRALLLLGDAPSRALIGTGFAEARGTAHRLNLHGTNVVAVASFPPRLLLQRPALKAEAWKDLQLLSRTLET